MNNQVIVYVNPDDPLRTCLMMPTGEVPMAELIKRHISTPYLVTDPSALPMDDYCFFEAWQLVDQSIIVNLDVAKDLVRKTIRQERLLELQKLDVLFMRAVEIGDVSKQQEIGLQKQKLRDLPDHPRISLSSSTAELRLLNVSVLMEL